MRFNLCALFLFLMPVTGFTQERNLKKTQFIDSLTQYSFTHLQDAFFHNEVESPDLASLMVKAYYQKAKERNDTIKIAHGYKFLSYISEKNDALKYSDSIIQITHTSNHVSFPTLGYLLKGYYLYESGDYEEALENYLLAYPYALEKNNLDDQIQVQSIIASLKNRWGKYDEALDIYKSILKKLENEDRFREQNGDMYALMLYNTSLAYTRNSYTDSASITIQRGLEETRKQQDTSLHYSFIFISGINEFKKKNYTKALNSIDDAIPHLNTKTSQAIAYYYRAKIFDTRRLHDQALPNYIKVDSLFKETNDEFPELPHVYRYLISHYKKQKALDKQLYYINRLLFTDSLIHKNQVNLNSLITKEYDTPRLLRDKEEIIAELSSNKKSSRVYITISIIIGFILLGAFLISLLKNRKLQARFDKLIEHNQQVPVKNVQATEKEKTSNKKLEIPQNLIEEILDKLEAFENKEGYLSKDVSIHTLSKTLKTNQNYLSKVINAKKGKNFSSYINDLRIDYIVDKLKHDEKLRKYSLQAIAEEVGYNKYPPFFKAFVKRTGLKPSYFIEKLKTVKS